MMGGSFRLPPAGGSAGSPMGAIHQAAALRNTPEIAAILEKSGTPTELSKDDVLCGTGGGKCVTDNSSSSVKKPKWQKLQSRAGSRTKERRNK